MCASSPLRCSSRSGSPAVAAARWAFLLGVLLAGGLAIFSLAVGPADRRLFRVGFALALAGGAGSLALQSTLATRYALAVAAGLGVAAVGLALARLARVAALLLPLVPTLSGHALDPGRSWLEPPAHLLHVAAAAARVGGGAPP